MRRAVLILLAALSPLLAHAQGFPSKPMRMIVPFPPGGPTDLLGRVVGDGLQAALGQPVVVENRSGAAGNLGVGLAARAEPDGHTFVVVPTGNIAVNPSLFKDLPYKPSDLAPVTMMAMVENVLVVNPKVQATSLKELLALARKQPGILSFGSPGAGSQAHLAGELLSLQSGIELIHVPYKGIAPAVNDLLGGQITMMFAQMSSALPHIQAGKLQALGVASLKRSSAAPDLPTIAEQGFPDFEAVSWYALMTPAGTPEDIIAKVAAETARIVNLPENRKKFEGLGMTPVGNQPQALAATIEAETRRWVDVIRKQNIKLD
jgi:tripartite-type tricarboxylate transporter receptor subunit TctC